MQTFYQKTDKERSSLIAEYMKEGEVRCFYCGKLIFKGKLGHGTHIQPRCPRCKKDIEFTVI